MEAIEQMMAYRVERIETTRDHHKKSQDDYSVKKGKWDNKVWKSFSDILGMNIYD